MARSTKTVFTRKSLLVGSLLGVLVAGSAMAAPKDAAKPAASKASFSVKKQGNKIGIFDLDAIRSVPLNPEVIGKTKKGNIVFEEVKFTSSPGVRTYMILSYKEGANRLPGIMVVDRFKAKTKEVEASNNYFAISVAPVSGNMDPKKKDTSGGPKIDPNAFSIEAHFTENPKDSYIYQHTVALLRALDYLESRSEVDISKTVVTGYSWPGLMVALLHALDDRPAAYTIWHGIGYYADTDGMSGGRRAPMSRKQYEMYGAGAYAKYGTKPVWFGSALDDYFARFDSIMEFQTNLQSEKKFVWVPNRHHHETQKKELSYPNPYPWQTHWQMGAAEPSTIGEGTVKAENGKIQYTVSIDAKEALKSAEVFVSYGKPGNWLGRTWHSFPLRKSGENYVADVPVYDAAVPFYIAGQIWTPNGWFLGNSIQFVEPEKLGISTATATYPNVLFDPSKKNDLYLRTGRPTWVGDSQDGKGSVILTPDEPNNDNGMVMFQNIDPMFWKGGKEISILLKGDGKPGPVTAYLAYDTNYYIDKSLPNFTQFQLIPTGKVFTAGWKEYVLPLSKVSNLARVGSLFIQSGNARPVQIGTISWR
jgi:dienelactone hydrolase